MIYKKTIAIIPFLLALSNSCAFLNKKVTRNIPPEEVISIMSLKIIYDDKIKIKNLPFKSCKVFFKNGVSSNITIHNRRNSQFYVLKSPPQELHFDSIDCTDHVNPLIDIKHHFIGIDNFAFYPESGFINYIGHIKITYNPRGFSPYDIMNLGSCAKDGTGKVDIKVEDRVSEIITFLQQYHPELENIPINKSFASPVKAGLNNKGKNMIRHSEIIPIAPKNHTPQAIIAPNITKNPNNKKNPYLQYFKPGPYYDPYQQQMITP